MNILYLLVIAHLLADFVFQGKALSLQKRENSFLTFIHSFVFFVCSTAFLFFWGRAFFNNHLLLILFLLSLAHFLIDLIKNVLENNSPSRNFEWLVIDQLIHLGMIVFVWFYLTKPDPVNLLQLLIAKDLLDKLALVIIGYLFMWSGTQFVRRILEKVPAIKEDIKEFNIGRMIGNLERIIIFTLVLVGQFAAVGLVLAAKSIARFEELREREFAEYYLLGTLMSFLIAIGGGLIIKLLLL